MFIDDEHSASQKTGTSNFGAVLFSQIPENPLTLYMKIKVGKQDCMDGF